MTNTTVAASGGKGTGPTCINNCTTGTPSPKVDCNANPSDPSCSQQPPPTTQTCTDGSQPDSSGKCPTAQIPPSQPSNPPNTSTPPSGSGSGDNGNGNGNGNGNNNNSPSGGGGSSSSGSNPPSPSTLP